MPIATFTFSIRVKKRFWVNNRWLVVGTMRVGNLWRAFGIGTPFFGLIVTEYGKRRLWPLPKVTISRGFPRFDGE